MGAKLHNRDHENIETIQKYSEEDTAYREFKVKLQYIKDRMKTKEGKHLAQNRHKFMINFFDQLQKENEGIK